MKTLARPDLFLSLTLDKALSAQAAAVALSAERAHGATQFFIGIDGNDFSHDAGTLIEECSIMHVSEVMRTLIRRVDMLCADCMPLLVSGESGTGKELFIRYIAYRTGASKHTCVTLNCGTATCDFLERILSEDMAKMRASVNTGRENNGRGLIVFLKETHALPVRLQNKLLNLLQRQVAVTTFGGPPQASVRIIASMNIPGQPLRSGRDRIPGLQQAFGQGLIMLPPLRERREDILPLAEYFLHKYRCLSGGIACRLSPDACEALREHPWPGNVRMLENTLIRSLVLRTPGQELRTLLFPERAGQSAGMEN